MTEVTKDNITKILAPEVDYKPALISNGTYIFTKMFQQSGADTATINQSIGSTSIFELPPKVYNLAKSRLVYTLTPTAGGANRENAFFTDTLAEIKTIEFYNRANVFPVRIEDVNKYLKSILRHETKLEEMLSNDVPFSGIHGGQTSGGVWEGLHQMEINQFGGSSSGVNNIDLDKVQADLGITDGTSLPGTSQAQITTEFNRYRTYINALQYRIPSDTAWTGGARLPYNDKIPQSGTKNNYKEGACAYYVGGNYATAGKAARQANSASPVITRNFPLSIFYNTLLAMNRDVYFGGETMYLRITWNNRDNCGFIYNSPTDADLSAGPATVLAGNIAVSNLNLYAAIEANKELETKVINMVMNGGFKMMIPYVWSDGKAIPKTTTTHNIEYRINGAQGKRLLKLYWSPYLSGATGRFSFTHSNTSDFVGDYGTIIKSFYVQENNDRRSQYDYDCTLAQDYVYKKDKLKGSCIQDSRDYYANWTWCEDFTNNMSLLDKPGSIDEINIIQGRSLEAAELKINITATRGSSANLADATITDIEHKIFAVVQRELMIGPGNIVLM